MTAYTVALLERINEIGTGKVRFTMQEAEEYWGISDYDYVSDETIDKWIEQYLDEDQEYDERAAIQRRKYNKMIEQENERD